jgi:uncharacterized membrane protein YkvA (DUF1232 family)
VPDWAIPLAGIAGGLLLLWIALMACLWLARPEQTTVSGLLRLLPDLLRLLTRLARDPDVPSGVRVGLLVLLGYLALPVDLIPDFVPVIGYADDAIIVALALRWVTRRAGAVALERNWPGTPPGLDSLRRLAGLSAH